MHVDKSEQRIREMFGEISPRYDLLNHLLSGGVDFYWRRRAVRAVTLQEGVPVLDVCTGTGDLAIAWWKRGRRRVPVVGSDFTHPMLVRARQKFSRLRQTDEGITGPGDVSPLATTHHSPLTTHHSTVCLLEADTQHLPFASGQFQVVSVAFGLRNVADTRQGLREMIRVCRPGGHVIVLEFTMPRSRLFGAAYRFYFRHVLPRVGQLVSGSRHSAYSYLPASVSEFSQGEQLKQLMLDCGLESVWWKRLTFGIAALYCGRKGGGDSQR